MKSKITTITQEQEEKSYQTVSEYLDYLDTIADTGYDDQDYQNLDDVQENLDNTFSENNLEDHSREIKQHREKITELQKDNNNLVISTNQDNKEINDKLSKAQESAHNIKNIEKDTQTKMQYISSKFNYYFSIAKSYAMFDAPPEILNMLVKVGGTLGVIAGIYFARKDLFDTIISNLGKIFIKQTPKVLDIPKILPIMSEPKALSRLAMLAKDIAKALGKFFNSF